jgi:hypothetical protein
LLNNGDEKQNGADLKTIKQRVMVSVDGAFLFRRLASHFDDSPTHFNLFPSILIYFDLFRSFRSISIHFDSGIKIAKTFRSRAGHFKIAKIKPVRHPVRYPHGRMRASHS